MSAFRSTVLGYEFAADSEYVKLEDLEVKREVDLRFMELLEEYFPRIIRPYWLFEDASSLKSPYFRRTELNKLLRARLNLLTKLSGYTYSFVDAQLICRYVFIDGEHRMIYVQPISQIKLAGNPIPFKVEHEISGVATTFTATPVVKLSWEHEIPLEAATKSQATLMNFLMHKGRPKLPGTGGAHEGAPTHPQPGPEFLLSE